MDTWTKTCGPLVVLLASFWQNSLQWLESGSPRQNERGMSTNGFCFKSRVTWPEITWILLHGSRSSPQSNSYAWIDPSGLLLLLLLVKRQAHLLDGQFKIASQNATKCSTSKIQDYDMGYPTVSQAANKSTFTRETRVPICTR